MKKELKLCQKNHYEKTGRNPRLHRDWKEEKWKSGGAFDVLLTDALKAF